MILFYAAISIQALFNLAALAAVADSTQTTIQVVTPLINLGIAGVMLWWFMQRDAKLEPRLKSIEDLYHRMNLDNQEAIDRVARINLMLVVSAGLKPLQGPTDALEAELDRAEDHRKRQRSDIKP